MVKPDLEEAAEQLKKAVSTKEFIALVCMCEADYVGRARSFLEKGERLIIVKEDTSFLIHRPSGLEPVNWQPPPNYIGVTVSQDHIVLTVKRMRKPEKVVVRIHCVKSIFSGRLEDKGGFQMYLSEKEISEILRRHPELVEEGFRVTSSEAKEKTGVVDIVGVDANNRRTIVEIKKDKAGLEAVRQLSRYARSIGPGVRVMLLAPGVTKEAERMLRRNGMEFRRISMFDLTRILMREDGVEKSVLTRYL
ncbi:MAG: endonuclease NucS [Crenarchaeota archaeon]|nr:endonuclease NucS [Thermoproteota archaeon]